MTLGRVQVQLPFIDSLDSSPGRGWRCRWRGSLHGIYFIPQHRRRGAGRLRARRRQRALHHRLPVERHGAAAAAVAAAADPRRSARWPATRSCSPRCRRRSPSIGPTPPRPCRPAHADGRPTVMLARPASRSMTGATLINMTPDGITITGTPNLNLVATARITITGAQRDHQRRRGRPTSSRPARATSPRRW